MSIENSTTDLIKGVMRFGPEILDHCISADNLSQYLNKIQTEHLNYPVPKNSIDKNNWFVPKEYENLDIEDFLIRQCPQENYERLAQELELFHKNGMIPVLRAMKYIVDTLRKNNIVWGVGRGSSVSSYVLYLIGVHKIDSVKYNLPIEEFFKGEING